MKVTIAKNYEAAVYKKWLFLLLSFVVVFLHGAEILTAENPTPAEAGAARELQQYLELLTGKSWSASSRKSPETRFELSIDPKLAEEEWSISGADGRVTLKGGDGRGLLYAVYHYLEDSCGVRFLAADAEYIPKLVEPPFAGVDRRGKSAYPIRAISTPVQEMGAFVAKRRLNRNTTFHISLEYGGAIADGSPYHCHTFDYYIPFSEKNKTEHPEYFSSNKDGERIGGQYKGQLCLSNSEVRKIMLARLREYIAKDEEQARKTNTASARIYDISQNDNKNYCRCGNCDALAAKYGGKQSGVMLDFINELADGIRNTHPRIILTTFAYQYTEDEPENIKPASNVMMVLCDTKGNLAAPISDASNAYFQKRLEGWSKLGKLALWDYGDTFGTPLNLPVAAEYHIPQNTRFLRKYQIQRYSTEMSSVSCPEAREYKYYLLSRFMEDPELDFEQVSREFADAYYGKAGGLFLQYRKLLRDSEIRKKSFIPMCPQGAGMYPHLDLDTVHQALEIFQKGRLLLGGDAVLLGRWNLAALGIDRAALHRRIYLLQEHLRRGGVMADFPLDFKEIRIRAGKTHLDYVDRMTELAKLPHWKKRWEKHSANIREEYAKLDDDLSFPLPEIPEQFKDIDSTRLYIMSSLQSRITPKNPEITLVEDQDALSGKAVLIRPKSGLPKPVRFGIFNYDTWKELNIGFINDRMIPGAGYHWIKIGSVDGISSSSTMTVTSWRMLVPLGDVFDEKQPQSIFDCWVRVKFDGDSLFIDQIVLIRDFPLRAPEKESTSVGVNNVRSYAVEEHGERWRFEYKRRFGLRKNASWHDELGPNTDKLWQAHPKHSHICGFNGNILLRFDLPEGVDFLKVEAEIGNSGDQKTRTFAVQYSLDGKNFITVAEQDFYPARGYISQQIPLPKPSPTIWIRCLRKIEPNDKSAYGYGALFKQVTVAFQGNKSSPL